jgi:hypothetical protein
MERIDELYYTLGQAYYRYGQLASELDLTQETIQELIKQIKDIEHERASNNLHTRKKSDADSFPTDPGDR